MTVSYALFVVGFAKIYDYGFEKKQHFMIMELLDKSLEELVQIHSKKFSISTVFQIGIQILSRL